MAEASMSLSLTQDQCVIGIKRKGEDSLFISLNFKAHPIHSMAVRLRLMLPHEHFSHLAAI